MNDDWEVKIAGCVYGIKLQVFLLVVKMDQAWVVLELWQREIESERGEKMGGVFVGIFVIFLQWDFLCIFVCFGCGMHRVYIEKEMRILEGKFIVKGGEKT